MPSEYYPEVFGGEMSDACEFSSLEEANEIFGLMMRHWNDIAGTLLKGDVYEPIMLEDEGGTEGEATIAEELKPTWTGAPATPVAVSTGTTVPWEEEVLP